MDKKAVCDLVFGDSGLLQAPAQFPQFFFFFIFFQLHPIIARGGCEVWVLIYLTVVILLMTLLLSAAIGT